MRESIARYLQKLALAFWLGEMLFFISIFAPRVFKVLPRPMAGELQNNIFPGYFSVGIGCALMIIVTQFYLIRRNRVGMYWTKNHSQEFRNPVRRYGPLILASLAGIIFAYCLTAITPRIAELQPALAQGTASESLQAEFTFLHRLSVNLNAVSLLCLLVLLGIL